MSKQDKPRLSRLDRSIRRSEHQLWKKGQTETLPNAVCGEGDGGDDELISQGRCVGCKNGKHCIYSGSPVEGCREDDGVVVDTSYGHTVDGAVNALCDQIAEQSREPFFGYEGEPSFEEIVAPEPLQASA